MQNEKMNYTKVVIYLLIILNFSILFSNTYEIHDLKYRVLQLEETQEHRNEVDKNIINILQDISENQKEQNKKLEDAQRLYNEEVERQKAHQYAMAEAKAFSLTANTDLCIKLDLTADDMNKIIDNWNDSVKSGTNFKGKGAVFVEAAKKSGLNPIYILAHAAWESSWGNSYIARTKHNFYGINATDTEPVMNAYAMGDAFDDGIINGALWIKENYYDKGYTNLNTMIYGGNYASAQDDWIRGITSIANASIRAL